MIDKNTVFNVYNEYDGNIYAPSAYNDLGYKFERSNEIGEPSITPVVFSDVQLINNKSAIFRNGTLRFDADLEDEIYKELRIMPDKNYLTKDEIEDIILNTDTDKLEKLIAITSMNTIEKVRSILIKLDNTNEYDIPKRVFDVVNARIYELAKGSVRSEIKLIVKKTIEPKVKEVKTKSAETEAEPETVVEKKTTSKKTK